MSHPSKTSAKTPAKTPAKTSAKTPAKTLAIPVRRPSASFCLPGRSATTIVPVATTHCCGTPPRSILKSTTACLAPRNSRCPAKRSAKREDVLQSVAPSGIPAEQQRSENNRTAGTFPSLKINRFPRNTRARGRTVLFSDDRNRALVRKRTERDKRKINHIISIPRLRGGNKILLHASAAANEII